jgi:hypothetical protein
LGNIQMSRSSLHATGGTKRGGWRAIAQRHEQIAGLGLEANEIAVGANQIAAEANSIAKEANRTAKDAAATAKRSFHVSVFAVAVSLLTAVIVFLQQCSGKS